MSDEVEVVGFSRIHLREAQRSAGRAAEAAAEGLTEVEAGATAAAILLSAASIEALLSELATVLPFTEKERSTIRDDRGASTKEKYLRFADALQDRGKNRVVNRSDLEARAECANLHCLIQLRNAVAHRKAAFLARGRWPREIEPCRSRIPFQRFGTNHWTSVLLVHSVAEWAARVAEDWLKLWKKELRL